MISGAKVQIKIVIAYTFAIKMHIIPIFHAYSCLQEMVKAAADMGLEVLGITEHGSLIEVFCGPIA